MLGKHVQGYQSRDNSPLLQPCRQYIYQLSLDLSSTPQYPTKYSTMDRPVTPPPSKRARTTRSQLASQLTPEKTRRMVNTPRSPLSTTCAYLFFRKKVDSKPKHSMNSILPPKPKEPPNRLAKTSPHRHESAHTVKSLPQSRKAVAMERTATKILAYCQRETSRSMWTMILAR